MLDYGNLYVTISKWKRRIYWRAIFSVLLLMLFYHIMNVAILTKIPVTNQMVEYDEYNCNCPRLGPHIKIDEGKWCSDYSSSRGPHQNVVAYTIYGDTNKDNLVDSYYGQISDRIKEVTHFYPGWIIRLYHNCSMDDNFCTKLICQFYCHAPTFDPCQMKNLYVPPQWKDNKRQTKIKMDDTVKSFLNKLLQVNSNNVLERKIMESRSLEIRLIPKMWRYLPLADPLIDYFLIRDVDSYILPREVAAVNQWIQNSTALVHVMRDHPSHNGVMLAGLWGGCKKRGGEKFTYFLKEMLQRKPINSWDFDQIMLRRIVWPEITNSVMVHDSYHCNNTNLVAKVKSSPFPTKRRGRMFVSWGPTRSPKELLYITECPIECRPKNHKNWNRC